MEIEMEGVPFEERPAKGRRSVAYWVVRLVIESVLAFGVFVVMSIIILGFGFDVGDFVKHEGMEEREMFKLFVFYEIIAIVVPWLIYGCFLEERKDRFVFLFRWAVPMSGVILVAMELASHHHL